jgi:hypothetical protein
MYRDCTTTAATPIPTARRRNSPQSLAGIRCDSDPLPRPRFGTVAFRDIEWRLRIAGTRRRRCFVKLLESIAKMKEAAEAFFD